MSDKTPPHDTQDTLKPETTLPELSLDQQLQGISYAGEYITRITDGGFPHEIYRFENTGGYSIPTLSHNKLFSGFIGVSDADNASFSVNKRKETRTVDTMEFSLVGVGVPEMKIQFMRKRGGKWVLDPTVHTIGESLDPEAVRAIYAHSQAVQRLVYRVQESIPPIGREAVLDPKVRFSEAHLAERLATLLQYGMSIASSDVSKDMNISAPLGYRDIKVVKTNDGTTCKMVSVRRAGEDDRDFTVMHTFFSQPSRLETLKLMIQEGDFRSIILFGKKPESSTWSLIDTKGDGKPVQDSHFGAEMVNSLYFPARAACEALRFTMPS